jgi:hypothetical protein
MVAAKTDINDSLEKWLHILKECLSNCNNDAMCEERQLSFNDSLHKTGTKHVTRNENIKCTHMVGSFTSMQLREHDQCKRMLCLQVDENRKIAYTVVLNICVTAQCMESLHLKFLHYRQHKSH